MSLDAAVFFTKKMGTASNFHVSFDRMCARRGWNAKKRELTIHAYDQEWVFVCHTRTVNLLSPKDLCVAKNDGRGKFRGWIRYYGIS